MNLSVLYATDENYAMYTGISMLSMLDNNTEIDCIEIHLLDNGISKESIEKLQRIANRYGRNIKVWDGTTFFNELAQTVTMKNTQTITAYACCFAPYILDDSVDSVLYMDGDSLILGKLSDLCRLDMTDVYAYGALDLAMPIVREKIGFLQEEPYINSGLLYMSLNNIRKANIRPEIQEFIEEVIPTSMHNDQDVINGVYKKHLKLLPLKYNVITPLFEKSYDDLLRFYRAKEYYSKEEVKEAIVDPVFVHFTASSTRRPWIKGCKHPMKDKWDYYKSCTEWCDVKDKPDNRRMKKRVLDFLYNNFPISLYMLLIKVLGKKRNR